MTNSENSLQKLLDFLDALERHNIYHRLERNRSEAVMVRVDVPGQRWEVEFFADGTVEIEIFVSENGILSEDAAQAAINHLLTDFAD